MSTYLTLLGLKQEDVDAEMIQYPIAKGSQLIGEGIPVHIVKSAPHNKKLLYSKGYVGDILSVGSYDIFHAQGIWQWPTYALVDAAKKLHKPYLITPRGMLYPQDIAKASTLLKKLSLKWRLLRDFNNAACVHVTCEEEMMHCRNLGITSPIAVITNPVEIKDSKYSKEDDVRRIGYLGRFSKRKNIEGLIYAFAALGEKASNAELLIIGGGDDSYEAFLKSEVERLQLKNVRFVGFLSGDEKDKTLASCSVIAMPSEFENLGNVILEGLVRYKPCIATKGAPWSNLEKYKCGWWIDYSQEAITKAVEEALTVSDDELRHMGERGRQLVEQEYKIESVAKKMKAVYEWILDKGEKPDFVYYNTDKKVKTVVHYISSIDRNSGGVGGYLQFLSPKLGDKVDLHIVTHKNTNPLSIYNAKIHYISNSLLGGMTDEFSALLKEIQPDVVHVNGCWEPTCALAQRVAQGLGYKVVLTPHGMLEPWVIARNHWTKKLPALLMYQKNAIKNATVLVATSEKERGNLHNQGYNDKVVLVPHGLNIETITMKSSWERTKTILYLGLLRPNKGVLYLIEAASRLKEQLKGYDIVIAGPDTEGYLKTLKEACTRLGVDDIIRFTGGVFDEEKWNLYRKADVFVLPTFNENFGIVVAEALSVGTPVITTTGSPWKELVTHNCGWQIKANTDHLVTALEEFLSLSEYELKSMGLNGRSLIEEKYTTSIIAKKMVDMYKKVINS